MKRLFLLASLSLSCVALADADPVEGMYQLSTDGTSKAVKVGEKGKVVIAISAKAGAHVSGDAPMKIELSSKELKADKEKLTLADAATKKSDKHEIEEARFEVPFSAAKAGKANLEAKCTYFICTDKVCARQQKTIQFPVDVN
ncbi:MAG: hypothetical protein QM723_39370 [Myxococcaceae bacterium]